MAWKSAAYNSFKKLYFSMDCKVGFPKRLPSERHRIFQGPMPECTRSGKNPDMVKYIDLTNWNNMVCQDR